MREAYSLVWSVLVLLFRSRASLEAEILILRHQLNIQRRHLPKRLAFSAMDRLIFVGLYRLVPDTVKAPTMDLFVVPTISFRLLYGLLIMGHGRRQILWFGVTAHRRPNGSPISSRKPVAGSKSLVT